MNRLLVSVAVLALLVVQGIFAANDTYSSWRYYRTLTVTPLTGVYYAVANIPLLVRLNGKIANGGTANDSLVFANSLSNGQDIRFSNDTNTTNHYSYQIETWDAINMKAAIWVKIPSIGISGTTYKFRMYYSNSSAGDSAAAFMADAATAVFSTANNFQAVYHMNDVGNGNISDATLNNYSGTAAANGGGTAPIDASNGYIGGAKYFSGSTDATTGGNFHTTGAANLNFAQYGPYTISAWVNADVIPTSATVTLRRTILAKSVSQPAEQGQYRLGINYGTATLGKFEFVEDATTASQSESKTTTTAAVPATQWYHVALTRTGARGTGGMLVYYNGVVQTTTYVGTLAGTRSTAYDVYLGSQPDGSRNLKGYLDEVRFENITRNSSWIKLCYDNQNSSGTPILALNAPVSQALSGLMYSSNPAVYQVSIPITTNTLTFSGLTDSFTVSPALPTGLTLNPATGAITGTATTVQPATNYTITGHSILGNASIVLSITINTPPAPGVPVLSTPLDNSTGVSITPTLTWASNNGGGPVSRYFIKVSTVSDFTSTIVNDSTLGSVATYPLTLGNLTKYYWEVSAYSAGGQSIWAIDSFTTKIATPVLSLPANAFVGAGVVSTLSWSTVSGAATYHVRVSTVNTFATILTQDSTLTGVSKIVGGLAGGIVYYWQVRAKDAFGSVGDFTGTQSFTTLGTAVLGLPTNGALGQSLTPTFTWATVNGAATYHLQVSTESTFGTTIYNNAAITGISQAISGLSYLTVYYWKVQAANASGDTGFTSVVQNFTAQGIPEDYAGYASSKNIVLNTKASGAGITMGFGSFPVLVRLNATNANDIFTSSQSNGLDIRFTNASGTHLPFQRERWDAVNKLAEFWVKVDTIKPQDTTQYIKLLWNNAAAVDSSNGAWVFDTSNGFQGVWHLNEGTGEIVKDATINGYNGTPNGTTVPADTLGMVGRGKLFDGLTSFVDMAGTASGKLNFSGSSNFTLSTWVYTRSATTNMSVVSKSKNQYELYFSSSGFMTFDRTNSSMDNWVQAASSVMLNRWAYVAGVNQSSGAMAIYLDGTLVSTSTNWNIPSPNNTYNVQLGKTSSGSLYFYSGFMDEVQLANVARSADWIKLSYKNQFFSGGKDFLTVLPPVTLIYASPSITGSAGTPIIANTATLMGGVSTYSATGLPAGLSISPTTGTISGTPTAGYASSAIITAQNAAGSILFTMPITISIAAPVLASPVNGATSQLRTPSLTWGSVIGATMYRVQLSTASDLSLPAIDDSTTGLSYTPVALTGNTTWYWRVVGKNGNVSSSWSSIFSFTTIPEIPGVVTISLPINTAADVSVTPTLTWTAGTGGAADIYMVKVSTSSTFSSLVVNDSTVTTTYTLSTTLTNSTVYYWEVAGKNSTGTGVFVSSYFTTVISAPGIVTLTSPAIGETGVVLLPTLTWTAGAGGAADKYIVKVSTSSVFSTTIINDSTVNLSYTIGTSLLNGTVYYWEVSGKNANSSGPNAVSIFITVAPLTPVLLQWLLLLAMPRVLL